MTTSTPTSPIEPIIGDKGDNLPNVGALALGPIKDDAKPTKVSESDDKSKPVASSSMGSDKLDLDNEDEDAEASGSDLDSNASIECDLDSDDAEEPDFEYDSDGNIIYWVSAEEQAKWDAEKLEKHLKKTMTPFERFFHHLPEVPAKDLSGMNKICGICATEYETGEMREPALKLPCGHYLGKECLWKWMGPKEKGGYGRRSFFRCRDKIVVPDEET